MGIFRKILCRWTFNKIIKVFEMLKGRLSYDFLQIWQIFSIEKWFNTILINPLSQTCNIFEQMSLGCKTFTIEYDIYECSKTFSRK